MIRAYDTTGPETFVHPLLDKKSFVSVTREREGDYTQDLVVCFFLGVISSSNVYMLGN